MSQGLSVTRRRLGPYRLAPCPLPPYLSTAAAVALRHMQAEQYRVTVLRRRRLLYMLLLGGCVHAAGRATQVAVVLVRHADLGAAGTMVAVAP